jgi:hypothetical protein
MIHEATIGGAMYGRQGFEITMVDDGSWSVEVSIANPAKAKEKKGGPYVESTLRKTLTAKDLKGVKAIIDKYGPGITRMDTQEENEFEKAFETAAKQGDK